MQPAAHMLTVCPSCKTVFRLTQEKVDSRREGLVRCGVCRGIFNAKWNLLEQAVPDFSATAGITAANAPPPDRHAPNRPAEMRSAVGSSDAKTDADAPAGSRADAASAAAPFASRRHSVAEKASQAAPQTDFWAPSDASQPPDALHSGNVERLSAPVDEHGVPLNYAFGDVVEPDQPPADPAERHNINMNGVDHVLDNRPGPWASMGWFLACIGFVFLLGVQARVFLVDKYAQDERYRSYLVLLCRLAQCELPARRDVRLFALTSTNIELHPSEPGALRVKVQLRNKADFEQPYPSLQLTMMDRVGRVVGRRTFSPDLYLRIDQENRVAAGQPGAAWFDLANPHEKAVGFVVDVATSDAPAEAPAG